MAIIIKHINIKDWHGYSVATKKERRLLASKIKEFMHKVKFDGDIKVT